MQIYSRYYKLCFVVLRRILFIIAVTHYLTACSGSKSIVSFEVLLPASITYPENVNNLGLLIRAPVSANAFSPKPPELNRDPVTVKILDTLVINNLKEGFFDATEETELPYFNDILLLESRRKDTIDKGNPISPEFRKNLFQYYDLDALITLEYYAIEVDQSPFYYDFVNGEYYEFRLISDILWRVYVNGENIPLDEYRNRDTLYYQNYTEMEVSENLTGTKVVRYGCYELGYNYGLRHITKWNIVNRIVFRGGNAELRAAAELTDRGEWEGALRIWRELTASDDLKIASKANHNIAVFYELNDDIETSLQYSSKALQLWENSYIKNYHNDLVIRFQNKSKIFKQFRQL